MNNELTQNNMPLSWCLSGYEDFKSKPIKLFRNKSIWLSLVELNNEKYINDIEEKISSDKLLIRGCDVKTSTALSKVGYSTIKTGKEAVLILNHNHFAKKSLKELIRRGQRHGEVKEYNFSKQHAEKLKSFKLLCSHGDKPQLKYLFWDNFQKDMRLFVFENMEKEWFGAILVSINSQKKLHTELLLRKKDAPNGIMEALVFGTFRILRKSNYEEWSLGEVPFIISPQEVRFFSKENFINLTGKFFRFAYNYEGLYNFKNKFNPCWQYVFLCGKPKISIMDLVTLSNRTNFTNLMFYKFVKIFD